ncbi:MAG: hypothetical protein EGR76_08400 [Prevotella stercorea]|nr:hypothetical protein [Leyella stercorea]
MATIDATGYDTIVSPHWYIILIYNVYLHSRKYALMIIYIYDETDTFISAWGLGVVSALYIERHFLFVTYLIISRYRKTQT